MRIASNQSAQEIDQQKLEQEMISRKFVFRLALAAIILVVIAAVALIVLAIVAGVVRFRKRRHCLKSETTDTGDRTRSPPTSLRQLALAEASDVLDLAALRVETYKIVQQENPADINLLLQRIDDDDWVADAVSGALRTVSGCRYPRILIGRRSQLALIDVFPTKKYCLHISKLSDYNGGVILVSQAPKRSEFAYFWRAIWQERVGVCLWIGNLTEGALQLIDSYIELNAGDQAVYGPFRIITTAATRKLPDYDEYRVKVEYGQKERHLIFVHDHSWPQFRASGDPRIQACQAGLVGHIRAHQLDQERKSGLAAILVHGSSGTERSPAFAASYIGAQMMSATGKVNLIGIIKYVRRERWQAFARPTAFAQVQIIFQTVLFTAERDDESTSKTTRNRSCQRRVDEIGRATD